MGNKTRRPILEGKKALIVGIANEHSIAYGCARAFREAGADIAITYLNDKARPHVEPLAKAVESSLFLPLDVSKPGDVEALFKRIRKEWGQLDIFVHSIASAKKEDIKGGLIDCSAEGFAMAMDISVHSFIRMARLAAPLMKDGGSMFAMSYHGAAKVVPNQAMERAPVGELVDIMDVGFACAYLASPYARRMTGDTVYVDGGINIMA